MVVPPELSGIVEDLQKTGKLSKALDSLPKIGFLDLSQHHEIQPETPVSKFVEGKILPRATGPARKRSRYDYEDEAEVAASQPRHKRLREDLPAEDQDCALFHPDNKHIRDRLHSNNAFRPPSEFVMPSTQFYEFRNGSQWLAEDDKRLRELAKEYSFNWSLIADELQLPGIYKTSQAHSCDW